MKIVRLTAALFCAATISACATVETASRNVAIDPTVTSAPRYVTLDVQSVAVNVPRALKVSERNSYYPGGDIVWREDPIGDRHAQVKAIFEDGLQKGLADLPKGGLPARIEVEVTRFHALTEKTRYSVGGVHAIQFKLRLVNPETGAPYGETRFIKADFPGYGGQAAIMAERRGITQKVRITGRIAEVLRQELSKPGSFKAQGNGLIGALNQI